jgi:hypothetical protein
MGGRLDAVAQLMDRDEPKVLVVVGAGVSAGATSAPQASWPGLLKHGVQHLVDTEVFTAKRGERLKASLDSAFSPFDLAQALQHADVVEQNLMTPDADAFRAWLESAFKDFKAAEGDSATLKALRALEEAGALLLTTNYDSLLSEATGLRPVTWEERSDFLRVTNRQARGILHVHGHWQRPSSVILGRRSYDRIVADAYIQDALKGLWQGYSWMYVGCGDGLDDPNLGALLEWGKGWGGGELPDYFLAQSEKAETLARRPDKPANLVSVGYDDHRKDLPLLLRSVTPAARCWPFVPIDADFAGFRGARAALTDPFPSYQEYLDGAVPALDADAIVRQRLDDEGWAFVLDVASVGKTTLALRLATAPEARSHAAYTIDCAAIDAEQMAPATLAAFGRVSRRDTLVVVDNAHRAPELARQLWDQWRGLRRGSKLLLIATRADRSVTTAPAQDPAFFEYRAGTPAIPLQPTPGDLLRIVQYLYRRAAGARVPPPLPAPPPESLQKWHVDYGRALHAFCIAALGRLAEFKRGNWDLPLGAAAAWVRAKWLKRLDEPNLQNLVALSVFGSQELELPLYDDALPHPGNSELLLSLGLAASSQRGRFGQYLLLRLREPGWGRLILAALKAPPEEERVLFETAGRHPATAVALSVRMRTTRDSNRLYRLWAYIAADPEPLLAAMYDGPRTWIGTLLREAAFGKQPALVEKIWQTMEAEPGRFRAHVWDTPIDTVAGFLEEARQNGRDTTRLWESIEHDPAELAAETLEMPLAGLAALLRAAKKSGRDTKGIWQAIESNPERFAERALQSPLTELASLFEAARRQHYDARPLWAALEAKPDALEVYVRSRSMAEIAALLSAAESDRRDTSKLWTIIEERSLHLGDEATLVAARAYIALAERHHRDLTRFWEALEADPERLIAQAWASPEQALASFLDAAERHRRDLGFVWKSMEAKPEHVAQRALEHHLGAAAALLDVAVRCHRDTAPWWEALERDQETLIARAWGTRLNFVANFASVAAAQGRDLGAIWSAFLADPKRLGEIAGTAPAGELAGFCRCAPPEVVTAALAELKPTHWDKHPRSDALSGAIALASRCLEAGRADLAEGMVTILLRRANSADFAPAGGSSLAGFAWLLDHVPPAEPLLVPFLSIVCTNQWVHWHFKNGPVAALAEGLRLIETRQPVMLRRLFRNDALSVRLEQELRKFADAAEDDQIAAIELLGAAALLRYYPRPKFLAALSLQRLAELPAAALALGPDAERLGSRALQLWLGVRTAAAKLRQAIPVPPEVVAESLRLWRRDLDESSTAAERWMNERMVTWLDGCSKSRIGVTAMRPLPLPLADMSLTPTPPPAEPRTRRSHPHRPPAAAARGTAEGGRGRSRA